MERDIDRLWEKCCAATVGPIIGHASDGHSRRRQIKLQDYSSKVGSRYAIPWQGWLLSSEWLGDNRVVGLHD